MPPKPRGGRAARGGRGGATASRSGNSDATPTATPQSAEPPVVLKQDDEDSKPPTTEGTPVPTESQQTPSVDPSYVFLVSHIELLANIR
jgi:hypothetical protein